MGGEPVGPPVQLGKGDGLVLVDHRDGVRDPAGLVFEERMHATVAGEIRLRGVPVHQERLAIGRAEHRDIPDRAIG